MMLRGEMTDIAAEKVAIRELVENWAVWRDARLWIVLHRLAARGPHDGGILVCSDPQLDRAQMSFAYYL